MNPFVELNLALILFLPWYVVLGVVFWRQERANASVLRRVFDLFALAVALAAAAIAGSSGFQHADPSAGAIWKQVLASLVGYGAFLLVLMLAYALRRFFPHSTRIS